MSYKVTLDYCDGNDVVTAYLVDGTLVYVEDGIPYRLVTILPIVEDFVKEIKEAGRLYIRQDEYSATLVPAEDDLVADFPVTREGGGCEYEGLDPAEMYLVPVRATIEEIIPAPVPTEEELAAIMGGPEDYDR
jgi:hypothetical protein